MKDEKMILYMISEKADYKATGIYENGKIRVLKSSKIRQANINTKRVEFVNKIRNDENYVGENLILKKDIVFPSPSTAAQFVADTSRNGLLYWRNAENVKLKDILNKGEKNG